ncbi:MAG: HD domain-containing protein [Atopobiaceae bacterium]|nr:HD domain-containing protein [Atopobiaceae bacterium]
MADARVDLVKEVAQVGEDIIHSDRFDKAKRVPHHSKSGNIACHSLETATYALGITRWLSSHGVHIDENDVVRASLLHDIGMTEDDVFLSPSRKKAYSHPKEGSRIAAEEFGANSVQLDAIKRHMWPIGIVTPRHATGWVVVAADKLCSMKEVRREAAKKVRDYARKRHS